MSYDTALASARRLKVEMERCGLRCSIELQAGRGADPWGVYTKYLRMWHHIASYYKPGGSLTPLLWLIKQGRPDVIGPLANGYLGFDGVYRIICMGEANHPGLGGPITIDGVHVAKNSARKPTWGTEVEGGYQTWEDIDRMGPPMLEYMGRADVALAAWSKRPLTSQLEHKTWAPGRKFDRKDFDAQRIRGIALTRKWFASVRPADTFQEDGMFTYTDGAGTGWLVSGSARLGFKSATDLTKVRDQYMTAHPGHKLPHFGVSAATADYWSLALDRSAD